MPRGQPSTPGGRGVRFNQGEEEDSGLDYELMRAAFADQATVQQEQSGKPKPSSSIGQYHSKLASVAAAAQAAAVSPVNQGRNEGDSHSPFAPGYTLSASNTAENVRRSELAQEIGPFDPVPDHPAPSKAGKGSLKKSLRINPAATDNRDDDEEEEEEEEEEEHHLKPVQGRRPTNAFIKPIFVPGGNDEEEEEAEEYGGGMPAAKGPSGYAPGFVHPNSPSFAPQQKGKSPSPSPKRATFQIDEPQEPPRSPRQQVFMPARPQPAASDFMDHHVGAVNRPMQFAQPFTLSPAMNNQAFSPRVPNMPFSPQPPANPWSQFKESTGPPTPHIQHYDPFSSPSMVQPFSPKVTATGSIKSPALKPALTRRDQSVENFRLDDSGDPCERGVVKKSDAEDLRKTYNVSSGTGVMKTLVGLYGASNNPGNGHPGQGVRGPSIRRHDSNASSSDVTLNEQCNNGGGKSGKDQDACSDASEAPYNPPPRSLSARRQSMAFTLGMDEELMEEDDPRITGNIRKSMQEKRDRQFTHRRASWSSETGDPNVPARRPVDRRSSIKRRFSLASLRGFSGNGNDREYDDKYSAPRRRSFDRRKSATTIQYNVAHVVHRQKFILKLAKALMLFGAPSHRIESQLNATANVLDVDAQFIHFPGIVIAAFGDIDKHTSETHFVKSSSALVLGQLHDVHTIYRQVVHDEIGVEEGAEELSKLLKQNPCYSVWTRIAFAAATCWVIAPLSFGGSFVDAWVAACYGAGLTFLNLHVAKKNAMYSNVFEISVAIIISFISRGLSTTGIFCYQAIASSGVILVLPGYVILCGSLELASKNMIAGSVRMVYAIIYSLFLGFGIAIGSDVYFLLDPAARKTMYVPLNTATEISGSFTMANETMPLWTGTFSFSNGTTNALNVGNINCERRPEWPWYRQDMTPWLNFLFVPVFSALLSFNNLQPWKTKELPVMIIIACIGYVANMCANHFVFNRSDVVSAIGSFVIGILGNMYSRIFRGTAFTAMAVAVLFLVPSGMAMAGGLAMTYKGSDGDLYSNGLTIGFRMVQVAIGITVGLFGSGLVVYSFGRRKGAALFAF